MNDARVVCGDERVGDLQRNVYRFGLRQRLLQAVAQRLACDKFGGDELRAVVRADFVNREDVRMIERGDGFGFLLKAA